MNKENMDELFRALQCVERGILTPDHESLEVRVDRAGKLVAEARTQGVTAGAPSAIPFLLHPGFTVHEIELNGTPVSSAQDGPIVHYARPVRTMEGGTTWTIRIRYSGEYTLGVHRTPAGERWYEFSLVTLWRPVYSLDLHQGIRFRVCASLPGRLQIVSSIADAAVRSANDEITCHWDTGMDTSVDFSFLAGRGEYAEARSGGMTFAALTMDGVPYRPQDVIVMAKEIVDLYTSLWGACPFGQLTIACPPGSASGNCAREGLVIAGLIRDRDLASQFGLLAHEIAHLWWGIGIRFDPTRPGCEEGLAEYAVLVADRKRFGTQVLRETVAMEYLPQAREAEAYGTALLDCTLFQPHSEVLRQKKGACAFLLLERALGEEVMAAALRDFASRFRGRAATPADLRATFIAFGGSGVETLWDTYLAGTEPLPDDVDRYVG